jgi:predicted permease
MRSLLALLLRLFPADFRERFGPEMLEQMQTDLRRTQARGRWSATLFAARTASDLVRAAFAERWSPTLLADRPSRREGRMMTMMGDIRQDLAHALRGLRRAPGFTALAVGTLGLALGALAGIFTVVEAVLLRPLPFREPDRVVFIVGSAPGSEREGEIGAAPEMFLQYQDAQLIQDVASQGYGGTRTFRVDDRAERIPMWFPSTSLFRTLGAEPLFGRLPVAEDDGKVVMLSHRLWTSTFNGDPNVVGRTVEADGVLRTVIAVMKPDFWWFNDGFLLWAPTDITPQMIEEPGQFNVRLVARMKPGTTTDAVAEELTRLARRLPERFGGSPAYARIIEKYQAVVRPIGEDLVLTRNAGVLWMLLASAAIVLLIACANVANLFLVRAERRQHDHAVRQAMGGTRTRLIRVALGESLVVALLAGVLGVILAQVRVPFLVNAASAFERLAPIRLSTTVLFVFAASLLAALLCGVAPALRVSSTRLARLREGGRSPTRLHRWSQNALVTLQTALALVLLIGSALLARSFWALHGVRLGFDPEDVMTFQFAPEREDLVDGAAFARFHVEFMDRIAALPDVRSVGVVNNVPLDEPVTPLRFFREDDVPSEEGGIPLNYTSAGGAYFRTMGIPLLDGRDVTREEQTVNPGVAVVSRSAAQLLWPGQNAVGRRIRRADGDAWHTVVGVVGDVAQFGPDDAPPPLVYLPLVGTTPTSWRITSPGYVVKTARAEVIAPEIRELIRQAAPGAPMYQIGTMEGLAAREVSGHKLMTMLLGFGAVVSLLLSAIGLFGVLSFVVTERTREIGVRMALGAGSGQVRRMVVAQGSVVVALGVVLGLAIAAFSTRVLQGLLFGVARVDPLSFAGMAALMLSIGWLASYLPARRASRVDPVEALRGS